MNPAVKWSIVVICLMIIWGSIIALFYLKADEVTRDPCSVCAERMGKKVVCNQIDTGFFTAPARIAFYPNGSIGNG